MNLSTLIALSLSVPPPTDVDGAIDSATHVRWCCPRCGVTGPWRELWTARWAALEAADAHDFDVHEGRPGHSVIEYGTSDVRVTP